MASEQPRSRRKPLCVSWSSPRLPPAPRASRSSASTIVSRRPRSRLAMILYATSSIMMPRWLPASLRSPFFGSMASKPTSQSSGTSPVSQKCSIIERMTSKPAAVEMSALKSGAATPDLPGAVSLRPMTARRISSLDGGCSRPSTVSRCGSRSITDGSYDASWPYSFSKCSAKTLAFSSGVVARVPSRFLILGCGGRDDGPRPPLSVFTFALATAEPAEPTMPLFT
eukprot:1370594-Prymnesium_polylepis.1